MTIDLDLLRAAEEMLSRAHAPYSGYPVGAALRAEDGSIFSGCNVENASYGLSACAERHALAAAVAAGRRRFMAAAVVSASAPLPYPCGACRQVLSEFCPAILPISVACADRIERVRTLSLGRLLPHAFALRKKPA